MFCYKFRLYPNKQQEEKLLKTFDLCRFTYNQLLEQLQKQERPDKAEIQHNILELKKKYPELDLVYSKTLQYECYRLFGNLRALAQLKKRGRKVGKLRFKGREWFKTINYNQSGFKLTLTNNRNNILELSKVGEMRIRCHRRIDGTIKQITIKKCVGKWFAHIITDAERKQEKGHGRIGLDLGVINFIADNKGNKIKSPLFLKNSLEKIQQAHQELSRKKKGSKNRQKAKQHLGKQYEKIENQRDDFLHKLSTKIVFGNELICIEKLGIKEMVESKKNKFWNKRNILDSSWGKFISMLKHKAESAGAKIVEVNPRNTTKMCSNCKTLQDMPLSQRIYICDCGLELDRDVNSARNILAQGLSLVEQNNGFAMKQEVTTSTIIR